MTAPELLTPRLVLRAHRVDDFADCAAMWADPAVTRFIGGAPSTASESWARLLRYAGHWALLGYGSWAVIEHASGRFVGDVGLADYQRELDPPRDLAPELGWALAPWAHGRGLGTESVSAALAWADAHLAAPRTACLIDPGNAASLGLARKVGFVERARTLYKGQPAIVLERARQSAAITW